MKRAVVIGLVAVLAGCRGSAPNVTGRPPLSMWFWTSPFELTDADRAGLKSLGIQELFVRAGTLSFDGDRVVPILRQAFRSPARIHLVYNADAGILRHLDEIAPTDLASAVATTAAADVRTATEAGCEVVGVQIDFDCPTRRLDRYGAMMKALRAKLDPGLKLSLTGLTSWLGSRYLGVLLEPVDFFAPQYYEGELPKRVDRPLPLGDFTRFARTLDDLGRLGKPVVVGIPSYGQCLLYTGDGTPAGVYRGLTKREAMRHPLMTFDRVQDVGGEPHAFFRAHKAGKDYWLVFRSTPASEVARFVDRLTRSRPSNVIGACLYRFPNAGTSMTNSFAELRTALDHESAAPKLVAKWRATRSPFAAIERGSGLEYDVTLTIRNEGNGALPFAPDALAVELETSGPIEELAAGDFDRVTKADDKVSLLRTRAFRAVRCTLDPGETATLGPIRTSANHLRARVAGQVVEIDLK